ncbi:hypothetical protein chiPu_0032659, partial [Chiloscyllium punctatum]|nr:hypothetical protein [Chiloscyllium punctatum]
MMDTAGAERPVVQHRPSMRAVPDVSPHAVLVRPHRDGVVIVVRDPCRHGNVARRPACLRQASERMPPERHQLNPAGRLEPCNGNENPDHRSSVNTIAMRPTCGHRRIQHGRRCRYAMDRRLDHQVLQSRRDITASMQASAVLRWHL